jgi:O-antigen/teichoic acid export membrane protein
MKKYLLSLFLKGHARTILAKKNIIISLGMKFISMIILFSMVSLSIKYLGKEEYGLWVLLSNILVWTSLFDFGLTNGLRNKLSQSLASPKREIEQDRAIVSTTYLIMFGISAILYIIISIVIYWVDWKILLQINSLSNNDIQMLLMVIFFAFSLNLFLKPIQAILNALQWPSVISMFEVVGSILSLIALVIFLYFPTEKRLLLYTIFISLLPIVVLILGSIKLFKRKLKKFKPSLNMIDFKLTKEVTQLGYSFFVIQLAGLIIAQTDTFIIATLFGTESVTDYNIVFRYFSLFLTLSMILLTPFWSAFTDAYIKKEFEWIKKSIRKLLLSFSVLSVVIVIAIFYADDIYKIWIDDSIKIPLSLSITIGIYIIVYSFSNIFIYFVNGTGYIKLEMFVGIAMALLNIPLSYLFAIILDYGISGVIISTIITAATPGIISFIHYKKIINQEADGIWIK